MAAWFLLVSWLALFSPAVHGCSITYTPTTYSMREIMSLAPVVVSGNVTALDEEHNIATVDVYCIFRSDDDLVMGNIFVEDAVFTHSCTHTEAFELGDNLVIALKRQNFHSSVNTTTFRFYEPDVNNVEAYEATNLTLKEIADICDMDVVNVQPEAICPTPNTTNVTCYEYINSVINSVSGLCPCYTVLVLWTVLHVIMVGFLM